ncbi:ATPase [Rhizobium albus]|nr:ATPase [Rhizobium albus]
MAENDNKRDDGHHDGSMRDIFAELSEAAMSDPDPVKRAQKQMQKPLPKRFYTQAGIEAGEGGFTVTLDGRPVRTPARQLLTLPSAVTAEKTAAEWEAQGETIDPATMPLTRLANTAIDGIAQDTQAVAEDVLRFAGTDLICYRADGPERLVERQGAEWDPVLDWAQAELAARFVLAEGVMHVAQPKEALAAFGAALKGFTEPLDLAALHLATSLTGSALIAMALARGALTPDEAWAKAHLDETWNAELWGEDYEAAKRRESRRRDFDAASFVLLARRDG